MKTKLTTPFQAKPCWSKLYPHLLRGWDVVEDRVYRLLAVVPGHCRLDVSQQLLVPWETVNRDVLEALFPYLVIISPKLLSRKLILIICFKALNPHSPENNFKPILRKLLKSTLFSIFEVEHPLKAFQGCLWVFLLQAFAVVVLVLQVHVRFTEMVKVMKETFEFILLYGCIWNLFESSEYSRS